MENTRSAYQLATLADCGTPDSPESPGALMLVGIADEVYDNIDDLRDEPHPEDRLNEIVDGWPSVYTYQMWEQFVDLCAWQESPNNTDEDMEHMAADCLYQIGERLARALWDEISEALTTCQDCDGLLSEGENIVCAECGAEREAQELRDLEANARDNEAQVAGDPD